MRTAATPFTMVVMTTTTFQEFFSQNLAEFGWNLSPADIPEWATFDDAIHRVRQWWDGLDTHSRDIFRTADFSEGLQAQGYFSTFPGLQMLFAGNPMGTFDKTINDIIICANRARYQVDEQPETVSDVHEFAG